MVSGTDYLTRRTVVWIPGHEPPTLSTEVTRKPLPFSGPEEVTVVVGMDGV